MKHQDIDHTGLTGVGDLSAHTGDTSDAHDASAISVLDTAANFTGTDVEAVLAELQDNIDGVSGGGAVDWNQDISASGASFTGWTGDSGTWASNGSIIQQTDGGAAHKRAHYNTKLPIGLPFIYEAEVRIVSGTGLAGLLMGYDGANNTGGLAVLISDNGNKVSVEAPAAVAEVVAYSTTIATNTYYKIRVIGGSAFFSVYLDGTLLTNYAPSAFNGVGLQHYIGLVCWTAVADFRNIKLWTLSTGLPA